MVFCQTEDGRSESHSGRMTGSHASRGFFVMEETPKRVNSIPDDPLCGEVLFLTDWVQQQEEVDERECIPCDLATIGPWYRDLLKKKGYEDLAAKVNTFADDPNPDPHRFAEVLDEVKEKVTDEETKRELLSYDCMMQKYDEEEA